jgi:ABC-type Na+ transport system ATPase subunit NatA
MIGCVSPPSGGTLSVLGLDPAADGARIRARLGVVPQEDTLDMELTVRDNLHVYGRYFDLPRKECRRRADELLELTRREALRLRRKAEAWDDQTKQQPKVSHPARPAPVRHRPGCRAAGISPIMDGAARPPVAA